MSNSVVAISADISQFTDAMNAMESQWKETYTVADAAIIKANKSAQLYQAELIKLSKAEQTLAGMNDETTDAYIDQKKEVDDLIVSVKQLNIQKAKDVRVAADLKSSTARSQRDLDYSRKSADYARKNATAIRDENRALKDKLLITSKAQQIERKYADLLKEVTYWQKKGIITTKEATLAQRRLTTARKQDLLAATRSNVARNSATNDLVRHVRQLETLVVGLYAVKRAYDATLGVGHEFNKMMEAETIGIALSIVQKLKDVDVTGQAVTSMEKWAFANQQAKAEIEEVRKINPFTPHTLEQTIQLYKTISGQVRAAGGNVQNALDSTKNLSIIAQAANVDFKAMLKTVDQLYAGKMKPSDMQIALSNILGLTQESIRAAKAAGNVIDFVDKKLANAAIAAADVEQSWAGVTSNFINAWTDIFSELQKPLFDSMKVQIKEFTVLLMKNKDEIVGFVEDVAGAIKDNWDLATITAGLWGANKAVLAITTSMSTLNLALLRTRALALGTVGVWLYFVDEVDSAGGAATKLTDYFRLGFATLKTIIFGAAESILSFGKSLPEAFKVGMAQLTLVAGKGLNEVYSQFKTVSKDIVIQFDMAWAKMVRGLYNMKSAIGKALNDAVTNTWNDMIFFLEDSWHDFLTYIGVDSIKPIKGISDWIDVKGADAEVANLTKKIATLKDDLGKPSKANPLFSVDVLEADAEKAAQAFKKSFDDPENAPWLTKMRADSNLEVFNILDKIDGKAKKAATSIEDITKKLTDIDFDPNKTTLGGEADDGTAAKAAADLAAKAARLADKMAKETMQRNKEIYAQKLLIYKIDLAGGKYLLSLESDSLKIFKEKARLAAELVVKNDALVDGTKSEVERQKGITASLQADYNLMQKMTEEMNKWKGSFLSFFNGDIIGGVNALLGETFTKISTMFGDLFGGLSSTLGSVMGGLAGAGIQLGLELVSGIFSKDQIEIAPEIGDATQKESESMSNALEDIYDVEYSMLSLTRDMRGYLSVIAQAFGNIESSLYRSNIDIAGDTFASQVTRSTSALEGTEIDISAQSLGDMMVGELDATLAWIVEYTSTSWLGRTKTHYETYTVDIANAFGDELAVAAQATFDSFRLLGSALNIDTSGLENQVIDIGRIDTTGMASDEVAAAIEARFSADVDYIAERYFSILSKYTEGSEGLFETAARVTVNMEQVTHSISLLGMSLQPVNGLMFELTEAMIDGAGGIDALNAGLGDYMDNFFSDQEQYEMQLINMATTFDSLGLSMPDTNDEFRALAEGLDTNTVAGAELFGELMTISGAFAELGTTLTDIGLYIDYINGAQDFGARTLELTGADDISMAAYAITASEEMLRAIEIQTDLSGITVDNYLSQLELAHLNNTLSSDQLDNWQTLGDALLNVEEATKNYTDLIIAEQERAAAAITEGISAVADAWLGNLSYLTLAQKDEYAAGYLSIAQDSNGTIDTVDASLAAAEASMAASATMEEYIPAFERYIIELQGEVPEATTDDVVTKLDELLDAVKEMDDNNIRITA